MAVTDLDKHCAKELKALRKNFKIKQQTMAHYLLLESQQQYSDLENGKKHFTDAHLLKICSVFRISITQLIQSPSQIANLGHIINKEDLQLIEHSKNSESKWVIYKKLFLETKIENIELKLKSLYSNNSTADVRPIKHKIHVLI